MNRKTKTVVNIALALLLLFCLVKVVVSITEDSANRSDLEEAKLLASVGNAGLLLDEDPEPVPQDTVPGNDPAQEAPAPTETVPLPEDPILLALMETDLEALRAENEDVVGWITIPDTPVDYPLLQWTDNDFYLNHTWKQTPNPNGSIFIEWQNSPDMTDFNTIIYGHNMSSGLMFGSLRSYRSKTYWEAHPRFYIVCDRGVLCYDIFAAHRADIDTIIYGLELDTVEKRTRFIRFAKDYSAYDTGIQPGVEDLVVTLSTCSGQGYSNRWVVQGMLNTEASYLPNG